MFIQLIVAGKDGFRARVADEFAKCRFLKFGFDKLFIVDSIYNNFQCTLERNIRKERFHIKRDKFITFGEQSWRYCLDSICCVESVLQCELIQCEWIEKDTFTGQYTNFDSFVPWRHKISWVRALIDRVNRICTPNKIKTEVKLIRKFLSWNGFPKRVANLLIHRFTTNAQNRASVHPANDTSHNNQHPTIWLTIPFVGDLTSQLVKKLKRKLRRCLVDPNVNIRIKEKTTKLCFFTSTKDKTPQLSQSNVVYEFICPGCNSSYIGKTNRILLVRIQEHALTDKESAIYKHLHDCDNIKHIQDLYNLPDIFTNENISPSTVMNKEFLTQTVRDNTNI